MKTKDSFRLSQFPHHLGYLPSLGISYKSFTAPNWLRPSPPSRCCVSTASTGRLLATTENLYLAAGKPEVRTKLNLLQLVLMAVLMYPLTIRYGIMGAAVAAMLPSLLVVVLTLHEAGKIIGENFTYIARNFVPAVIGSLIMAVAIWGWQDVAGGLSPVVRLAVSVVVGGAVYVGYLWWRNREIFYEVKGLVGRR